MGKQNIKHIGWMVGIYGVGCGCDTSRYKIAQLRLHGCWTVATNDVISAPISNDISKLLLSVTGCASLRSCRQG